MSGHAISVTQSVIHHAAALRILHAVIQHAESLNVAICAAVVDSSGLLAGFIRMPGAFLISGDLATKKASSVAALGIDAATAEHNLSHEAARVREGVLHHGFMFMRGGLPIHSNGALIGALGVSGDSEAQDIVCAEPASQSWNTLEMDEMNL